MCPTRHVLALFLTQATSIFLAEPRRPIRILPLPAKHYCCICREPAQETA